MHMWSSLWSHLEVRKGVTCTIQATAGLQALDILLNTSWRHSRLLSETEIQEEDTESFLGDDPEDHLEMELRKKQ